MQVFLVGGAVRDQLLGLPVKEKDWVVVGADASELLAEGFRQVGRDFPVFLHPKTNEEYALARTERKIGKGYTGFSFNANKKVTLEEDLCRRDLTINAMAQTLDGKLIDPYGGQSDLEKKYLRHVSEAFIEDPVRILRVARFAARFAGLGFRVAPETIQLMKKMVAVGEVNALVAERVWKEFERALKEPHPEVFFQVLEVCHALPLLFFKLFSQKSEGMLALKNAVKLSSDPIVRFAALLHDQPFQVIRQFTQAYPVPKIFIEVAQLVSRYHTEYAQSFHFSAEKIINLLQSVDAFRRPERFDKWLKACAASTSLSASEKLIACLNLANTIDSHAIVSNFKGKEIAKQIHQARIQKIRPLTS